MNLSEARGIAHDIVEAWLKTPPEGGASVAQGRLNPHQTVLSDAIAEALVNAANSQKRPTKAQREILRRLAAGDLLYVLPEKDGVRYARLHKNNHNSTNLRRVRFKTMDEMESAGWIKCPLSPTANAQRFEFELTDAGRALAGE
jgi:hypothetical protein